MTAFSSATRDAPVSPELTEADRQTLLRLAVTALQERARGNSFTLPDPAQFSAALRTPRATFVTLRRHGDLRGCCGSVRPREPLCLNVVRSTVSAASSDPRFPAVEPHELPDLDLHISLLSRPQRLSILTEADLVAVLRQGIDGLVLTEESRQGVFLPSVWEQIATRREFVRRLKQKAGLPPDYWSPWLRIERFTAESLHGPVGEPLPQSE